VGIRPVLGGHASDDEAAEASQQYSEYPSSQCPDEFIDAEGEEDEVIEALGACLAPNRPIKSSSLSDLGSTAADPPPVATLQFETIFFATTVCNIHASMHANETTTVLNEIKALILDERQVCTFKFVAKKFHLRYDESKQLLYQYQKEHGDAVDATYLMSGIPKAPKHADQSTRSHVVKIVPAIDLPASKASFAEIDSLHVYSLSPKGVMTPENLVEVDLALNREALGTTLSYQSLGRVAPSSAPERRAPGAGRRPSVASAKLQKTQSSQDAGQTTSPSMNLAEQKRKGSTSAAAKPEAKKKRGQVIDSDEDEPGAGQAVRVTTYINDKGEEVTEIEQEKAAIVQKADKVQKVDNKSEKKGPGAKNPVVGKGQKGIMGFFKPNT
jgi:hypothetical protein